MNERSSLAKMCCCLICWNERIHVCDTARGADESRQQSQTLCLKSDVIEMDLIVQWISCNSKSFQYIPFWFALTRWWQLETRFTKWKKWRSGVKPSPIWWWKWLVLGLKFWPMSVRSVGTWRIRKLDKTAIIWQSRYVVTCHWLQVCWEHFTWSPWS
jgi:hypothetical protein